MLTDHGHDTNPDGKASGEAGIKLTAENPSLIYNKSVEEGELPVDWKRDHLIVVYKFGS